jgi:IMP cyclohydrolase
VVYEREKEKTMFNEIAELNAARLKANAYPGRGIVIGATQDGTKLAQIYWIMGRSENSRNRIFLEENGFVRTKAYDDSKVKDPSLIIYYPAKFINQHHIISNGDQTDTVYDFIASGKSFEDALATREFEPDTPNFTPRITGLVELGGRYAYSLSILKSQNGDSGHCVRNFFNYEKAIPGYGHMIHTYSQDGNPLPSFDGEPVIMPIPKDAKEAVDTYWLLLNAENRISLLAKYIDVKTGKWEIRIVNKHMNA